MAAPSPPPPASEGELLPQEGAVDDSAAELLLPATVTASPQPTPTAAPSPEVTAALAEAPGAERAIDEDAATAEARALPPATQVEAGVEPARDGALYDLPLVRLLAIALGIVVILMAAATLMLRRRL